VPVIADLMPTKWSYEALMVRHFKDNDFEKHFFHVDQKISFSDFKQVYLIPELEEKLALTIDELNKMGKISTEEGVHAVNLLYHEIQKDHDYNKDIQFLSLESLVPAQYTLDVALELSQHLEDLKDYYAAIYNESSAVKEKITQYMLDNDVYHTLKRAHHNEKVADIVKKVYERNKILEADEQFIQQADPIFKLPVVNHLFDIRSHFYAPSKHFAGYYFDTYFFNMLVIWLFTVFFYVSLYYDWLRRLLELPSRWKKNDT
jgi:polyhydroxyalkanoate synthesis regulator phasin